MASGGKVVESGLDVHGLPDDDDVDHQAKGAELIFLTSLIVLPELAFATVEDVSGQTVAALAAAEDSVSGPAVDRVVAVVQDVEGLDHASQFDKRPAQGRLVRPPLQGAKKG